MKTFIFVLSFFLYLQTMEAKLYQVFSLIRHGARYHAESFYDSEDTKPFWLELTAVGMRQQQKLGRILRKQYINDLNFLSGQYNRSEVQIYSTAKNRTQQSSSSLLYGLYPPSTGPKLTFVDRTQHIPPYSNKTDVSQQNYALPYAHQPIATKMDEKIILTDCPNYSKFKQQNFEIEKDSTLQMVTYYTPFMKRMANLFNFTYNASEDAANILYKMVQCYDVAIVNYYLGRAVPSGFSREDYRNVQHLTNWYYYLAMSRGNSLMVNSQRLQQIINNFDLKVRLREKLALKWTFLFGHDTDILAMHQALNISNYTCTEELFRKGKTSAVECEQGGSKFASNLIVELHSDDEVNFYVKVRSNGKYVRICQTAKFQCQYAYFKTMIRKGISNLSLNQLCGMKVVNPTSFFERHPRHRFSFLISE